MAYSTLDDIKKRLPEERIIELTADDGDSGSEWQSRINEVITDADGEINTYIGNQAAVPLSTVPAIIEKCSAV